MLVVLILMCENWHREVFPILFPRSLREQGQLIGELMKILLPISLVFFICKIVVVLLPIFFLCWPLDQPPDVRHDGMESVGLHVSEMNHALADLVLVGGEIVDPKRNHNK